MPGDTKTLFKRPNAYVPLLLSLAMFGIFVCLFFMSGPPTPQPDEGVAAHLFQIWLVVEAAMILFFALKWLPRKPQQAAVVLATQILGVLVVCSPVFYFKL